MGSFFRIGLIALVSFVVIGGILEIAFRDHMGQNKADTTPAASAYIASHPPQDSVPPMPDAETLNPIGPSTGLNTQAHQGPYSCTAQELSRTNRSPMNATVTRILDGDTLKVAHQGTEVTVRLWGIDAPELNQPLGPASKSKLSELSPPGYDTLIYPIETDVYGRTIATIGTSNYWAHNMTMVAYGLAYHVDNYESKNDYCLSEAQKMAQAWQEGVWKDNETGGVRPWDHRGNPFPSYGGTKGSN